MTDYNNYDTFLNPLDALAFDIAQTTTESDQQNAAAELALWVKYFFFKITTKKMRNKNKNKKKHSFSRF